MRLIDADAIMEALNIFNDKVNGNEHFLNGIETAKEIIDSAPTIETRPVRRKKDASNIGERIEKFGFWFFIIASGVILPPLIVYVIYLICKEIIGW